MEEMIEVLTQIAKARGRHKHGKRGISRMLTEQNSCKQKLDEFLTYLVGFQLHQRNKNI